MRCLRQCSWKPGLSPLQLVVGQRGAVGPRRVQVMRRRDRQGERQGRGDGVGARRQGQAEPPPELLGGRAARVEACAASRGKCKHSAAPFVRGTPRVGYPAASADERNWLCLPSAAALLPAATSRIREPPAAEWAPRQMGGFDALSAELRAEVEGAFSVAA